MSSESLQPNLPGMLNGALDVPGLHEAALTVSQHANVKVYAKLVNPRLEGLSDGVNLENPKTTVTTTSSDVKHTETGDFSLGAASGGVTSKSPERRLLHRRHRGQARRRGQLGHLRRRDRQQGHQPQAAGPSGLVTYDVEYRVVADLGGGRVGVVDLRCPAPPRCACPRPRRRPRSASRCRPRWTPRRPA